MQGLDEKTATLIQRMLEVMAEEAEGTSDYFLYKREETVKCVLEATALLLANDYTPPPGAMKLMLRIKTLAARIDDVGEA